MIPVLRRYTLASGTLDVFANLTDDVTSQAPFTIFGNTTILDVVMDPAPANTGARYEYRLLKNGNETPVKLFSLSMLPTSAGRVAVGPINMSSGTYIWSGANRAGTPEATSILVKYSNPIA